MSKEFTRDDLEHELVMFDKQKLITQCLKLFDTNKELVSSLKAIGMEREGLVKVVSGYRDNEIKLRSLKFWPWVNEWFLYRLRKKGGEK